MTVVHIPYGKTTILQGNPLLKIKMRVSCNKKKSKQRIDSDLSLDYNIYQVIHTLSTVSDIVLSKKITN